MPWVDNPPPVDPVQQWERALKNAFTRRISAAQLANPLKELAGKYPAPSAQLASILVGFRARNGAIDDLLLFHYAEMMLRSQYITAADLLTALLAQSRFSGSSGDCHSRDPLNGFPTCDERLFSILAQLYTTGAVPMAASKGRYDTVHAVIRWLHAVCEHETAQQLESGGMRTLDYVACGMYEALGLLAITILGHPSIRTVARQLWWKHRREVIVREMIGFDMQILQWMNSQLAGRLQALLGVPPYVETDSKGRPIITAQQAMDSVVDLPTTHTRAGLYIWLNACLCGRPLTDDMSLLGYLQTRYLGDNQAISTDLVIASFDVLTNVLLRRLARHDVKLIRSFICNKVPLLLAMLSAYLPPQAGESCIQAAFMSITMEALPPITPMSSDVREVLKGTRLEFLQACALHGLMAENTISTILQEPPIALPRVLRFTKEDLLAQCNNNVARLEVLADELQGMQGNTGAVAGCIIELLNSLCANKDTMALKTACNILMRQVADIDIVMQYTQPVNVLLPLCSLLNEWTHDQDQTEFTPPYEEFASILLFTLAIVHRYDLTVADLGLAGLDCFVVQLLQNMSTSRSLSNLSDEQNGQLAKWIEGLFATDELGETSGISDEVMRYCPPQAFYLLVPTLLEQSVLACKNKSLGISTLKSGLELLLEPFLLPSLVGGLSWIVKHSWESHGDAEILLHILDKLLRPSSTSQDTQIMHKAVLAIVATPLTHSLWQLKDKRPEMKVVPALIELLQPHVDQQRTGRCSKVDTESWTTTSGGAVGYIRSTIREMVVWTLSVGPNPPPKHASNIFTAASQSLGSEAVIAGIVAELRDQTAIAAGSAALDTSVALIAASMPAAQPPVLDLAVSGLANEGGPFTIRESLTLIVSDVDKLLKRPVADAEALIRLSRKVETQLTAPQLPSVPISIPVQQQSTEQLMQDLGLANVDMGDPTSVGPMMPMEPALPIDITAAELESGLVDSMDLTMGTSEELVATLAAGQAVMEEQGIVPTQDFFGDLGIDMGQTQAQVQETATMMNMAQDGEQNTEEDIFAGLDLDLGDDFNFG